MAIDSISQPTIESTATISYGSDHRISPTSDKNSSVPEITVPLRIAPTSYRQIAEGVVQGVPVEVDFARQIERAGLKHVRDVRRAIVDAPTGGAVPAVAVFASCITIHNQGSGVRKHLRRVRQVPHRQPPCSHHLVCNSQCLSTWLCSNMKSNYQHVYNSLVSGTCTCCCRCAQRELSSS